jgi:hypothetical protein
LTRDGPEYRFSLLIRLSSADAKHSGPGLATAASSLATLPTVVFLFMFGARVKGIAVPGVRA